MEILHSINNDTVEKQELSIRRKELNLKICENRDEMQLNELLQHTREKLLIHAKNYVDNEPDQENLAHATILKIIDNDVTKENFFKSNTPIAYAQRILENLFKDEWRKNRRLVYLDDNKIETNESVSNETLMEIRDLNICLKKLDKTDRIILEMFGKGYTYKEMHEDSKLNNFSVNNLRQKCRRARLEVAKYMGKKI
tara:strand:- start:2373 stop:2963 length:591 start_codon:yes stop_codon:yes gene_type:complete